MSEYTPSTAEEQPADEPSMSVQQYIKKPVTIEAVQWVGNNAQEVWDFTGADNFIGPLPMGDPLAPRGALARLYVAANTAWLEIEPGEWIIRDSRGFYPCKPDIFEATYDLAADLVESQAQRITELRRVLFDSRQWGEIEVDRAELNDALESAIVLAESQAQHIAELEHDWIESQNHFAVQEGRIRDARARIAELEADARDWRDNGAPAWVEAKNRREHELLVRAAAAEAIIESIKLMWDQETSRGVAFLNGPLHVVELRNLLDSTPSAALAEVKAQVRAEALRTAAESYVGVHAVDRAHSRVYQWLRARAEQIGGRS